MTKKFLLTGASIVAMGTAAQAEPFDGQNWSDQGKIATSFQREAPAKNDLYEKLSPEVIADFTQFSYDVNKKGWEQSKKAIQLTEDGWKLDAFKGTTGTATHQVESMSGLLAFKGDHVVIATRGTEQTNLNDWATNARFSRSPVVRFFASETNKLSAITAQFFGGVEGEVANGFLQTHLSSWDYIKEAIMNHAQSIGKSTSELHYTITGHSKGAAKAQLNALSLLTDPELAIGTNYLEKSFLEHSDLEGEDDFLGVANMATAKNRGNVDTVVFESPRVFSNTTAQQVDAMGQGLTRIENRGDWSVDPVVHVTPAFLGFNHAGATINIDSGGNPVERHLMNVVREPATKAITKHRETLSSEAPTTLGTMGSINDVQNGYFDVTTKASVVSNVPVLASKSAAGTLSIARSFAKKIWGLWG
ncbi:MAG: Lipase (class 3) [Alphaproteobacteria bacterium]|jgi:hypothetical protein|nr:Lipase (class 3) [Alphaproteobacteria bacterium]